MRDRTNETGRKAGFNSYEHPQKREDLNKITVVQDCTRSVRKGKKGKETNWVGGKVNKWRGTSKFGI